MSAERFFGDSDVRGGERYYNWKERTGAGPEDLEDEGIARSSDFFRSPCPANRRCPERKACCPEFPADWKGQCSLPCPDWKRT